MSSLTEQPQVFACGADTLLGILASSEASRDLGVVIVVGGPQYRAGSHRQFTLLARALSQAGFPTLRFDYRGMGDSAGALKGFEHVQADIRAAVDCLCAARPEVRRVVLWGLCDAASAISFYAASDARICGAVLANPWVRTPAGEAQTMLKHYYRKRLLEREFWLKLLRGGFRPLASLRSLLGMLRRSRGGAAQQSAAAANLPLPERMLRGLQAFDKPLLVLLSGQDYVAREFDACCEASSAWQTLLGSPRVQVLRFPDANHTFSSQAWRGEVETATRDWLKGLA